jgi:hypothetical protein
MDDRPDPNPGTRTSMSMRAIMIVLLVIAVAVIAVFLSVTPANHGNVAEQESAQGPLEPAR